MPYFLVPGNHEGTTSPEGPKTISKQFRHSFRRKDPRGVCPVPPSSFGYGNAFFIGLDANIPEDEKQYQWIKGQLALDRESRNVCITYMF